jgi:plasmid stabilization system protein ParE
VATEGIDRPVVLLTAAELDLEQAAAWYDRQLPGLGASLRLHIDATLQRIESHPELYPVVFRHVRRALTRRFQYIVYYRLQPTEIEVVAILNCRIDPAKVRTVLTGH